MALLSILGEMGQLESISIEGGEEKTPDLVLNGDLSLDGVAAAIRNKQVRKICVLTGAGISVSAGIPDFRSPSTGIYANLQKYRLPTPESMFDIEYFKKNPYPFFEFARELYPGLHCPTYAHYFIRLLEKKGLLLRNYTQNIDGLERLAGISDLCLVEAHGSFATCSCIECGKDHSVPTVQNCIDNNIIPRCCECDSLVKPDIVFFQEPLPIRYTWMNKADMINCDLLIVIGTSLSVQPFAGLVHKVRENVPRLLINREAVGPFKFCDMGCCFRDVRYLSDCDSGVRALAEKIGWLSELEELYTQGHASLSSEFGFASLSDQPKCDVPETTTEPSGECVSESMSPSLCPADSKVANVCNDSRSRGTSVHSRHSSKDCSNISVNRKQSKEFGPQVVAPSPSRSLAQSLIQVFSRSRHQSKDLSYSTTAAAPQDSCMKTSPLHSGSHRSSKDMSSSFALPSSASASSTASKDYTNIASCVDNEQNTRPLSISSTPVILTGGTSREKHVSLSSSPASVSQTYASPSRSTLMTECKSGYPLAGMVSSSYSVRPNTLAKVVEIDGEMGKKG